MRKIDPIDDGSASTAASKSSSDIDIYYRLCDTELDQLTRNVSNIFHEEKYNFEFPKTLKLIEQIVELARRKTAFQKTAASYFDLAYLLRRYATVLKRDQSNPENVHIAREFLEESLAIFKLYEEDSENIHWIEKSRVLHQLRAVAYEMKDGTLLLQVVTQLQKMLDSPTFLEYDCRKYWHDVYESLFHVHFGRREFDLAERNLELAGRYSSSYYRHRSKLCYAKMLAGEIDEEASHYFVEQVEGNFWRSYDANKANLKDSFRYPRISRRQAEGALLKDLIFLLAVRCQRSLMGMDKGVKPIDYVFNEAKKQFPPYYSFYLQDEDDSSLAELETEVIEKRLVVIKSTGVAAFRVYFKLDGKTEVGSFSVRGGGEDEYLYRELSQKRFTNYEIKSVCFSRLSRTLTKIIEAQGGEMADLRDHALFQQVKKTVMMKLELFSKTEAVPLDYQYFNEFKAPGISLTAAQIGALFEGHLVSKNSETDESHAKYLL